MPSVEDVARYGRLSRPKVRVTPEELGKGRGYEFPVEVRHVPQTEVSPTTDEAHQGQQTLDVDAFSETVANLFRCDYPGCPRTFESRRSLSYHKSQSHLAGIEDTTTAIRVPGYHPPKSIVQDDGKLRCEACGYLTVDEKSMGSHKRAHYTAARAQYVRQLEIAAAEVGGLRRALREANHKLGGNGVAAAAITEPEPNQVHVAAMVEESPLTVEKAMDFILEQIGIGDERILELEREVRRLSDLVDTLQVDDHGEAVTTVELIKESYQSYLRGDTTMVRFLAQVEDALALIDPTMRDDND